MNSNQTSTYTTPAVSKLRLTERIILREVKLRGNGDSKDRLTTGAVLYLLEYSVVSFSLGVV